MANTITTVMAQLDLKTAAIKENTTKIIKAIQDAKSRLHADIIVFPELTITSYPPEDLLEREHLYYLVHRALDEIAQACHGIVAVVGYPRRDKGLIYNCAAWIQDGKIIKEYIKQELPNYGVFDEKRYFTAGDEPAILTLKGTKIGIMICEDVWHQPPMEKTVKAGAELIVALNASPYSKTKIKRRNLTCQQRADENQTAMLYVNLICGQDDLLFDGSSIAVGKQGDIAFQAPTFEEGLYPVTFNQDTRDFIPRTFSKSDETAIIYKGLIRGIKDYINKNGFSGVIIGLSGGIDSAVTLTLAVDALGKDRVHAVMMPSEYTSDMSLTDAKAQAKSLEVNYQIIPIQSLFSTFEQALETHFEPYSKDKTEENLQARIRGTLLMALSNKTGNMVLSTGNKSEMAVGYATLYGDMAGGFCALKDVEKTLVYKLAHYRNTLSPVIPQRVIDRPPSAELAHNQKDEDHLPPYDILDQIIDFYVEQAWSMEKIIQYGFDAETVKHVIRLIHLNEHKRQQAPPGPRITEKAFGRDRRYPITSGYLDQL